MARCSESDPRSWAPRFDPNRDVFLCLRRVNDCGVGSFDCSNLLKRVMKLGRICGVLDENRFAHGSGLHALEILSLGLPDN